MAKSSMPSQEFLEKKELIELKKSSELERHNNTMEELKFRRESEKIHHDHEMERQRIKVAEIRKSQERKLQLKQYGY